MYDLTKLTHYKVSSNYDSSEDTDNNKWFYDCPVGWRDIFYKYLVLIDNLLDGSNGTISIDDIKEKFGELCFYYTANNIDKTTYDAIDSLVEKMETETQSTCICCGKHADFISVGWINPYCKEHIGNKNYIKL